MINKKISQLIPIQLPQYIRDDPSYDTFKLFLQAYYEWMETQSNALYEAHNLLDYDDIDLTSEKFLDYFVNDFLQYFPKDSLISKPTALKAAKQLYGAKGTLSSYKFLFRILYNENVEVFLTSDAVLRPSDASWYLPKYLRLATTDSRFLHISGYKIFGETSKAYAVIESSVLSGNKTNIFISNIERPFLSGENIFILNSKNEKLVANGSILSAKLVGQISKINVDQNNKGSSYSIGDPVILYGGTNPLTSSPVEATAKVKLATKGSMQSITVTKGGVGYDLYPNTIVSIQNAPGAIAVVDAIKSVLPPAINIVYGGMGYRLFDTAYILDAFGNEFIFGDVTEVGVDGNIQTITYRNELTLTPTQITTLLGKNVFIHSSNPTILSPATINLSSEPRTTNLTTTGLIRDSIYPTVQEVHTGHNSGYLLGNTINPISWPSFLKMPTANAQTKLIDALTLEQLTTYTIGHVALTNPGGSINPSTPPIVTATEFYASSNPLYPSNIANLGILGPIEIVNPGSGYSIGDEFRVTGGTGFGAFVLVTGIDGAGGITELTYINRPPVSYSFLPGTVFTNNWYNDPAFLGSVGGASSLIPYYTAVYGSTSALYEPGSVLFPSGGMGYTNDTLPSFIYGGVSGTDAILKVSGVLGTGAELTAIYEKLGEVLSIEVTSPGEDYVSAPSVSLRVVDVLVKGISGGYVPVKYDTVYQGGSTGGVGATFYATVDSVKLLVQSSNPTESLYNLRLFEYNIPTINFSSPLNLINHKSTVEYQLTLINSSYPADKFYLGSPTYSNGMRMYGDGTAKAVAEFLNGLSYGQGQYLTLNGQLSSSSVLQSLRYNDFTYELTVKKEIEKYRDILLNLLHPSGTQPVGRCVVANTVGVRNLWTGSGNFVADSYLRTRTTVKLPIWDYLANSQFIFNGNIPPIKGILSTTFAQPTTNILYIDTFGGFASYTTPFQNDYYYDVRMGTWVSVNPGNFNIELTPINGKPIRARISSVPQDSSNTIILNDYIQLVYANVALVSGVTASNTIHINKLTGYYDLINNGNYSNTTYPLMDIVYPGYQVRVLGDIYTVELVDALKNTINVTPALITDYNWGTMDVKREVIVGETIETKNQFLLFEPTEQNILTRYI